MSKKPFVEDITDHPISERLETRALKYIGWRGKDKVLLTFSEEYREEYYQELLNERGDEPGPGVPRGEQHKIVVSFKALKQFVEAVEKDRAWYEKHNPEWFK